MRAGLRSAPVPFPRRSPAVRHLEDEALLNAGIGACLNAERVVELDAGVMEGRRPESRRSGRPERVRHRSISRSRSCATAGTSCSRAREPRVLLESMESRCATLDLHHRQETPGADGGRRHRRRGRARLGRPVGGCRLHGGHHREAAWTDRRFADSRRRLLTPTTASAPSAGQARARLSSGSGLPG